MQIRFLGTSFGAPSVERHQQSLLAETDSGDAYLVDAGAPVLDILVNEHFDLSRLKAIFITHLHGDHMTGLLDILNLACFYGIHCEIWLSEQRGIDGFEAFCEMMTGTRQIPGVPFRLIREGDFYDDGVLRVKSVQTAHMTKPCYGFLLAADGTSVYVTGDLHPSLQDFPAFLDTEETGMIITECAHFEPSVLYDRLRRCRTRTAAVIHVMPPSRYRELESGKEQMPYPVLLPADGDVVPVT